MRILSLLIALCSFASTINAQKINEAFQLHLKRASSPIKIDGILDEETWITADVATDFFMVLPMDTSKAKVRTEVRMAYDDQNLYLIASCFHLLPGRYFVESLRRDFAFGKNDNFLLFMDPFDDQTNGFSFGANAAGAQWDGTMYEGGKVDLSWDNKWTSVVKSDDGKWVFEAAIPFKSIRYKKGITKWGINFSRLDLKTTEKSSWAPVPRQFPTASLAYSGILVWDQPPPDPGVNISLIPYVAGGLAKAYEQPDAKPKPIAERPTSKLREIGGDAKISLSSSLNLDITVNPDFSQVDVDQQVINLDRFELFFPERRQFFLENGDLFANFGYATIRPFFSRRIGLGPRIEYGVRLSGKLNKNWRIGAMNMQTDKLHFDSLNNLPRQNFTVFSIQRKVFARSNFGLIFVNKESLNYSPSTNPDATRYSQYNRNFGFEYNLASSNNLWTGKALFLKSLATNSKRHDEVIAGNLQYWNRKLLLSLQTEYIGRNYNPETGYIQRTDAVTDVIRVNPQFGYLFFPTGKTILSHGPKWSSIYAFDESLNRKDNNSTFTYMFTFRTQSVLSAWVANNYAKIFVKTDPQNWEPVNGYFDVGTEHHYNSFGASFTSKPQSVFTYLLAGRFGGYYQDGELTTLSGEIGYRFQPFVNLLVKVSYNDMNLPQPWGQEKFWLISPRLDITMTNKLFFTAFAQYNKQKNNVNLNTRFQWRYRPASDLFIVYTDNYLPDTFGVKTRSLVLKFTYWWNI